MKRLGARLLPGEPPELLVWDQPEPCPYVEGRVARMPLRLPMRPLSAVETDARLELGDRRHGRLLYRPQCPDCRACEAIRIDVARFTEGRTQRRILRRGDAVLEVERGEPRVDEARIALYERHKRERGLGSASARPLDADAYFGFLVDRCVDAFELAYRFEGRLVGVAVTDRAQRSLSAVYTLWDPALSRLSLGTYSILKQLELARRWGLPHLYLGLYVQGNPHMRYKAAFVPHERRVGGAWREFADAPKPAL